MKTETPPHNEDLESTIAGILATQPELELVILFGSAVTSHTRVDSDIDLAVDAGHCLSANEKMTLISVLAEGIGRPVDLIDLRSVGEPLLGQILRHGKRIMGSDECYANLIRRHVFDEADFMPYRNRILTERRHAWIGK